MKIEHLILKGIKDDILKNTIQISMELERTPGNIRLCEELSQYKPTENSSGEMNVTFEPRQLLLSPLFDSNKSKFVFQRKEFEHEE